MDIRLQPKPEIEITPADKGIVSRREYFVEKKFEEINEYFFPGHLIRNWKPKAELIYPQAPDEAAIQYECDFNRDIQNCFVEDYAEEVFLRSPPPCFVIIGKVGTNVSKLGEEIAKEYGSVLIQVNDIVNQVIKTETETSKLLERILRLGVSLTLNFILALLSFVAHTEEARHRGYVLCGLPSAPHLYDLSVEQQFNYLFTWDNKPTVFVNVLFDDEDLVSERTDTRCEIVDDGNEKKLLVHPHYNDTSIDEDEEEEQNELLFVKEKPLGYERDIDISPSRPWIQLPRDEEAQVWSELELFDIKIKPMIEMIISRVDPQYLITVDSRCQNEFEVVQARLKLLQIWKSPLAIPFISPKDRQADYKEEGTEMEGEDMEEDSEEDVEIKLIAEEPPEIAFLTLFHKKTISPKYRWELSHYNYICPVSLRAGEVVKGKSEFAVIFLKYIYFLRDRESMLKFLRNPRPYVLPIRPKPLCRFIILGLPFTGKTTLAKSLASEFSIPIIDVNTILKNDSDRKKSVYQEFCRQKAESREIIRLTAQAWKDWRLEEEQRVCLIEEWVLYIQTLLQRRIKQFYSLEEPDNASYKETQVQSYSPVGSSENTQVEGEGSEGSFDNKQIAGDGLENKSLEVRGVSIGGSLNHHQREYSPGDNLSTPSAKIIHALTHDDYNFNANGLEVEANVFFSSLWNTFSNEDQRFQSFGKPPKDVEEYGECQSEMGEDSDSSSITVNWCSLLPPQSLSSFLIKKKQVTRKEKRKSFKIFLEAASKAYWAPSQLKKEFVKWRLPCFMDIPLCEIYLENPVLLFRYIPEWLKERPIIPDPVDPMHPSVLEAGRKAFLRARIVTIRQNTEEKGILLMDGIEKAEREGMRVSGEVISPGGWVVDNMILDQGVWDMLAKRNVIPDHVYFLMDSEPEFLRIIKTWWDLNCQLSSTSNSLEEGSEGYDQDLQEDNSDTVDTETTEQNKRARSTKVEGEEFNLLEVLTEKLESLEEDEHELDEIFNVVLNPPNATNLYIPPFSVDLFSHNLLHNSIETWYNLKQRNSNDDSYVTSLHNFNRQPSHVSHIPSTIPVGIHLQIFTSKILNLINEKFPGEKNLKIPKTECIDQGIKFFIFLLTLPKRLEGIKEWLNNLNRGIDVKEIDILGKTPEKVFSDIREDLFEPFIKKPRELENFEVEEIQQEFLRDVSADTEDTVEEIEGEGEEEEEEREDVRIYGESGPLCIVNLERNILLYGKQEFALRYYGKLYFFFNEDDKNKFIEDPEKYAPYYSPIRCLPPLRVFIVGPIKCGKTSIARHLSNQCSLKYEDHIEFLNRRLIPYMHPLCEKLTALTSQKLLLSDDHNKEAREAIERFLSSSFVIRQFWMENPFYSNNEDENKKVYDSHLPGKPLELPQKSPTFSYKCIESVSEEEQESIEASSDTQPQEEFFSMKEVESNIRDYLQGSELNDYCIEKSIKNFWLKEPHISKGLFLEGFPLKNHDVRHIIENKWYPDVIFEVTLPEETVIERNIDSLMDLWDTKLKHETVEEKLLEEAVTAIQRTQMIMERNDLVVSKLKEVKNQGESQSSITSHAQKLTGSGRSLTSRVYINEPYGTGSNNEQVDTSDLLSEDENLRIKEEVEEIIKMRFPPLVFNANFETFDSGRARILEDLMTNYRRDMEEIEKIKATVKDLGVPWIELNGLNPLEKNYVDAMSVLDPLKRRENCRGEYSFTMSTEMAEILLQQGYYFLSKFGRWCPVQVYRMRNSIHMYRPLSKRKKITPVAYRNYIYFIGGTNEKRKFMEDPIKYTFNEPHHPNIPLRVAVIGPPKSGKTTLSRRLGLMFDLKVVTMGSALRFVLEKIPQTTLSRLIDGYLRRGCFLPLSLKIEALIACLNDPVCATQGFVIDGIPFDAALTQSLAEEGKLPFVIISLVADSYFGKINRQKLDVTEFRLPYKNRVNLDSRYKEWDETYRRFFQWNQDTYNNLYEVNAKSTIVDIFYQAYDIIRKSFFGILYYVEYCVSDRALPLQYLCVSQHEYELRKSLFHNNCPVCWLELNKLNSSSDPPPRSGLVQYLNYFYWVCPDHTENFLKNPKAYLPPNCPDFPKILPKVLSRSMFETASLQLMIHGYGRCPVTRIDFPASLDWEGSWDCAVSYGEEVYLCKNKKMLERFIARPWRYCYADTEFEVDRPVKSNAVEQLGPPLVTSLPPIGFLEQTVANLIHDCLKVVGTVRPVYPELTPTCTGCILVALYLKVFNTKNKSSHLCKRYFDFMMYHCQAYRFQVHSFKTPRGDDKDNEELFEVESGDSSPQVNRQQSSHASDEFFAESCWLDFDSQADKKLWSAKCHTEFSKMILNFEDELTDLPEAPKINVILNYQTYSLRPNPLPPVANCLTFIYSVKDTMTLPGKFNYNSLYQPEPFFSSQLSQSKLFNPDKAFSIFLHPPDKGKPEFPSETKIETGKFVLSDSSSENCDPKSEEDMDTELQYMMERFIPRFQLFDKVTYVNVPPIPEVVEVEPIIFNPHRDYAYTLLLSEFFHSTHVLKCHQWDILQQNLEYSDRLNKNLALTTVQVEFIRVPKKTVSVSSRNSIMSYQDAFNVANFFVTEDPQDFENDEEVVLQTPSLVNFMQGIILEKMDELFVKLSASEMSFDSYEINISADLQDRPPSVSIWEVLPYPPLTWDIISRPYYAYHTIPSIFDIPHLDQIAHERHVSLLDGIKEPNEHFRFVRYPSWIRSNMKDSLKLEDNSFTKKPDGVLNAKKSKFYFVFEFFDLPWTSFLTYPFSWAYNQDIRYNFENY